MPHGKCHACEVIFEWHGYPLLRTAFCPRCGQPLARTAANLERKMPVVGELPVRRPQDAEQPFRPRYGKVLCAHEDCIKPRLHWSDLCDEHDAARRLAKEKP